MKFGEEDIFNFGGEPLEEIARPNTYKEYIAKREAKQAEYEAMTDKCPTCARHHCTDQCHCSGSSVGHCPPYADPEIHIDSAAGTIAFSYYDRMGHTNSVHGKSGNCADPVVGERQKLVLRLLKGDDDDPDFHAGLGPMMRHFHGITKRIVQKKAEKERLLHICLCVAQEIRSATGQLMRFVQDESTGEAPNWEGYTSRLWAVASSVAGRSLQSSMHVESDLEGSMHVESDLEGSMHVESDLEGSQ